MECVLELRDVSKHYPSHHAVNGVSLNLARGEFFSLLGPSGCGKTTTLRLVAGFEEPTHGEIRLNGSSIQHLKPYQRNVSTVFQNYALFPHLTVRENVEFGLRRRAGNHIGDRVCPTIGAGTGRSAARGAAVRARSKPAQTGPRRAKSYPAPRRDHVPVRH